MTDTLHILIMMDTESDLTPCPLSNKTKNNDREGRKVCWVSLPFRHHVGREEGHGDFHFMLGLTGIIKSQRERTNSKPAWKKPTEATLCCATYEKTPPLAKHMQRTLRKKCFPPGPTDLILIYPVNIISSSPRFFLAFHSTPSCHWVFSSRGDNTPAGKP